MTAMVRGAAAVLLVLLLLPAVVRAADDAAPFDLMSKARDLNGLMLNPRWRTERRPGTLDLERECGILGLHGAPGFRNLLLRRKDCFGDEQRGILRLNEPGQLVVGGAVCNQAADDGFAHGHLNWFPVTMTGAVHYNSFNTVGGDYDVTFEMIPEDPPAPATHWNGHGANAGIGIHLELDYRETTCRLAAGTWWRRFHDAARQANTESKREAVNGLLGTGRAIVTGLFNLDMVHHGHSELHPVYAMAVLVQQERTDPTRIRQRWALMVRDRGNQGNCAGDGAIPFRLGPDGTASDEYRFRVEAPEGTSGPPEVQKDLSWIGVSTPALQGPFFHWTPDQGLQIGVRWPRAQPPRVPKDVHTSSVLFGDLWISWTRDSAPPSPAQVTLREETLQQVRELRKIDTRELRPAGEDEEKKKEPEAAIIDCREDKFGDPIETTNNWSPQVLPEPRPEAPPLKPAASEVFGSLPRVAVCMQDGAMPRYNPLCSGDWSIGPAAGMGLRDGRHALLGLSAEHARVYLFGRILHFRGSLYYDHQTDDHRGFAAAQAEALIGPIQRVGRIYGVLSAGGDVQFRQNGADAAAHPTVGFGLGVPLRPGYHVGANLEAFCLRPIGKDQRTQWTVVLKMPLIRF
jgi:hypothetical protein